MVDRRRISLAFVALYVALSVIIMSPLARSGLLHSTVWPEGDASISIWANGYVAHFWTWGSNPLYTSSLFFPHGLNLLANTTSFGLALLLAPLTWLCGPVASFNLELFVLPTLSAMSMQWALRRVVPSPVARGVAGLIWGFSPFAMEALYWGWPNFLYLVTPPILWWVTVELLHPEQSPRRLGILAGIAFSCQVLVGGEVAAICLVVLVASTIVVTLWSLVVRRWPGALTPRRLGAFLGWGVAASAPLGIPVGLYALAGPAHLTSWVWPEYLFKVSIPLSVLWSSPVASGAFHPGWNPVYPSHFYFGPVLLIVALVAVLTTRRAAAAASAGLGILGLWLMCGASAPLHLVSILWRLPVVHNIVVGRYVLVAWFAVALAVALGVERSVGWLAATTGSTRAGVGVTMAVVVASLVAPATAIVDAGPWHSQVPRVDRGLGWVARHEPPTPVVAAFPLPESSAAMLQQVANNLPIRLIGGWGPQPGYPRSQSRAVTTLIALSEMVHDQPSERDALAVAHFFAAHHVTDLIVPQRVRHPHTRGYREPYQIVALYSEIYGSPTLAAGDWHWNLRHRRPITQVRTLSAPRWRHCAWQVGRHHPEAIPACVGRSLDPSVVPLR
jgi:hypothetical protein